ncbi:MAG: response regulator transcription factor [Bacteriovoracaceae bacterium]
MERWIAYIDDSQFNLEALGHFLSEAFRVDCYLSSPTFLKSFPQKQYDAILVDLHMPQMNGFETYEAIVQHPGYNGCPILIISSDDSIEARVKSFELGAVDFINRTTSIDQMTAQINSKIQFFKRHRSILALDGLKVDQTQLKVFIHNEEVLVTFIEMKLLSILLRSYPEGTSKEDVIEYIWGDNIVTDNTIHTHIFNLNTKLTKWPHEIRISKKKIGFVEIVQKRKE